MIIIDKKTIGVLLGVILFGLIFYAVASYTGVVGALLIWIAIMVLCWTVRISTWTVAALISWVGNADWQAVGKKALGYGLGALIMAAAMAIISLPGIIGIAYFGNTLIGVLSPLSFFVLLGLFAWKAQAIADYFNKGRGVANPQ